MQMYQPLSGEKEILIIRRFPLFVVLVIWSLIKRICIPLFIVGGLLFLFDDAIWDHIGMALGFFSWYVCILLILAYIEWLNEELDILIVTDKRIIIFIQKTLFKRQSSIAGLDQIQDVKGVQTGMLEHFLDIGTVEIQTAAEKMQFQIQEVKDPEQVSSVINKAVHEAKEKGEPEDIGVSQNDFLQNLLQGSRDKIMGSLVR